MSKVLAVTGLTGKKSGGGTLCVFNEHKNEILSKFPDGIKAIVQKHSDTSAIDKVSLPIQKCVGEIADEHFLRETLTGVDTVLHIAGIMLSKGIVDAAVKCKVRRIICVHTTGIYSKYKEAGEEYRKIDAYVEKQCALNNIALTILRPTMIYGNIYDNNVVKFIAMVDKLPFMPVVNNARYALQPVHYMDLSEAYYQVVMREETIGRNYNLSGGEPIFLRDMLIVIGKNLGKKVRFISCPFEIAYAGACLIYGLSFKKIDYREKVQRLCEPRVYQHDDAKRDFGYSPRAFEVGIIDEVKAYKDAR